MSPPRHPPQRQSLNYFQQSPVRGQLEPEDTYSRTGWRYLQCTDTPNELRVLLPPRTALIYSNLLRAETLELAKDRPANWDRIMQIRHLKDRMIRKCQRLVKASAPADKNTARVMFFTLHAPPDFRLKEMERWFRNQGSEFADPPTEPLKSSAPYCCSKCGPLNNPPPQPNPTPRRAPSLSARPQQQPTKATSQLARSSSERVPRRPSVPPTFPTPEVKSTSTSYKHRQPKPPIPVPHRPPPPSVRSTTVPRQPKAVTSPPRPAPEQHQQQYQRQPRPQRSPPQHKARAESHPPRTFAKSPEPLPIPYRSSEQRREEDAIEPEVQIPVPAVSSSPLSYAELPPEAEVLPPREPSPTSTLVDLPSTGNGHNGNGNIAFPTASCQPLETIHEKPEGSEVATRPPLVRRRSSLKNGGGMSRLSVVSQTKSVTWAMDRDWVEQMSKYENATQEAEVVCQELDAVRAEYRACVAEMRELCRNIAVASEKIRLETEILQREEYAVHTQELKLLESSERVERKESQYHEKVLAVLEETKRVVQLCDRKRDHRDD